MRIRFDPATVMVLGAVALQIRAQRQVAAWQAEADLADVQETYDDLLTELARALSDITGNVVEPADLGYAIRMSGQHRSREDQLRLYAKYLDRREKIARRRHLTAVR